MCITVQQDGTSLLTLGKPDRVMAAVRVFDNVAHHSEAVSVKQGPILHLGQAGMIKRLPVVAAQSLAMRWPSGEQQ